MVVFDDIQWGEETFLDLIEHVALLSSGASLLLLCMARPELLDCRPTWPVTIRLKPLDSDDAADLIGTDVPEELRARIATAAAGNPLFISEMVAMTQEVGDHVEVPASLKALLAARLDQLDPAERRVLECGSVEGEVFHRGAVQALTPEETQVTPRLAALVRRELIRSDRPQFAGEDGFRFRHLLIRDTAYDALPKAVRAELHERFAAWVEQYGELVELDEIVGYHLEQTCRYRGELGARNDELARVARRRLTVAGRRARRRGDKGAAVNLFQRAMEVLSSAELDLGLESDLVWTLFDVGRSGDALRRADGLAERAATANDQVGELCGAILASIVRSYLEPEGVIDELAVLAERALPVFQVAGDDVVLFIGYWALGAVSHMHAQNDAAVEAYDRAASYAEQAGLGPKLLGERATCRFYGTTHASALLAWLDEQGPQLGLSVIRSQVLAMLGRFDEARAILAESRARLAESGAWMELAYTTAMPALEVELLAGDPAAAAELGSEGCRQLEELGERSVLSTAAGELAQALYALDRLDEADLWAGRAATFGSSDDVVTQMLSRQVQAKVLARRGEPQQAERFAREAIALAEGTDQPSQQGDAYADLGEVLALAGRAGEATTALQQARACYERKGNLASTQRTQKRLAELEKAAPL